MSNDELLINKNIELWNRDDCLDLLHNTGSKKYTTIAVKWSLLKKYLIYIHNPAYKEISKQDLEGIESTSSKYIPYDTVLNNVDIFVNNIDKALILLLRNGIKGDSFSELTSLKDKDIKGNEIHLDNRVVVLDEKTTEIINKAKYELGYRMLVKKGKKTAYDYYSYNNESIYFWKNRKNKFNNDGLNSLKPNASKDKINKLITRMNVSGMTSTSLVLSYTVDKVIEFEDSMNMILTEKQVEAFIRKIGVKINMYSVYILKNELRDKMKIEE